MLRRIAITGPESTGKSELAQQLAEHYNSSWVPEFARQYLLDLNRDYRLDDVSFIAENQEKLIHEAFAGSSDYVFADTEMLVCAVWADFVFGHIPQAIRLRLDRQQFDLYLLCYPDLPWEPDPLREHPTQRMELFNIYEAWLKQLNWKYAIIKGIGSQRLQNAVDAVNRCFIPV